MKIYIVKLPDEDVEDFKRLMFDHNSPTMELNEFLEYEGFIEKKVEKTKTRTTWSVPSDSREGMMHTIVYDPITDKCECSCEDFQLRRKAEGTECKHIKKLTGLRAEQNDNTN